MEKSIENISYKIKCIDSIRFISSSLTRHDDNLSEIYIEKCSNKSSNSKCEFKGVENNKKSVEKLIIYTQRTMTKIKNHHTFNTGM